MIRAFIKTDGWVLERYQSAAHKFQRFTGKTNFWFSGLFWLISGVLAALMVILFVYGLDPRRIRQSDMAPSSPDSLWIDFCVAAFFGWRGLFGWQREESKAFARIQNGQSNPKKISPIERLCRAFPVMLGVSQIAFAHVPIFSFAVISGLYLEACDPLPPCVGKVREWLNEFHATPSFEGLGK